MRAFCLCHTDPALCCLSRFLSSGLSCRMNAPYRSMTSGCCLRMKSMKPTLN